MRTGAGVAPNAHGADCFRESAKNREAVILEQVQKVTDIYKIFWESATGATREQTEEL